MNISQQHSESSNGQRHAGWARVCAIAILAISVVYALMLPSGGMASMSYDSFRYLAGAHSILASGTYLDISGVPQLHWPPGTSILYAAAASLSGRPPEELVKFVNLAALLLMAGSLWLIVEITIDRWWIALITFASILLNTSILSLQSKLWSDPLALATSFAAIASAVIACRGGKKWWVWIYVASAFLSIAIFIRYAMLPGIPVLIATAFWVSKRTRSHREAVVLPLLTPLVMLISFYFVRSSRAYPFTFPIRSVNSSVNSIRSFDFPHYWLALGHMTDQIFPAAFVAAWLTIVIVAVGLFAVPVGTAFVTPTSQKRSALLIFVGYVFLSCIFLAIVPVVSTFPFGMDYRYLLPIYPFILIGAAVAADLLLNRRRPCLRILGLIVIGLLSLAAARSARAAALALLGHGSEQSASCVSGMAISDELKRIPVTQNDTGVLTNAQGIAWYAKRTPDDRPDLENARGRAKGDNHNLCSI